jgi:hypothetical protein
MMRYVWLAAGVVATAVGIVVALTSRASGDFGWFAYTPGNGKIEFSGNITFVSRTELIGAAVAGVGLVVVASGLGYLLGRRGRR